MAGGKDKGPAIVRPALNGIDASVMIAFNDVMDIKRNAWKPDGEIVAHSGQPVRVDADFFAPPPAKIGQVVTAESTLSHADNPLSTAAFQTRGRVVMAVVFLLIAGAVVPMFIGLNTASCRTQNSSWRRWTNWRESRGRVMSDLPSYL